MPRVFARRAPFLIAAASLASLAACGSDPDEAPRAPVSLGEPPPSEGGGKEPVDGGYEGPDGGVLPADRFVTGVVGFTPGACAGYGAEAMPDVVYGPPVGAGGQRGSLDVVSLGLGGEIVLSFGPNAIIDGPGPDFIVFENAFVVSGDPGRVYAEPGEVSVSDDGVTWHAFECPEGAPAPYASCAGVRPVYSAPGNGVSPFDPDAAGGDAFDLADLGVARARFVRIRDRSGGACEGNPRPTNAGFDLDAVAIVNAASP